MSYALKSSVSAAILASFVAGPALAADAYYPSSSKDAPAGRAASFDWTGPFIGIHGGWADGNWDGPLDYEDKGIDDGFDGSDKKIGGEGWFGGIQVGYDHQVGQVVVGAEADVSYGNFEGDGEFLPYPENKDSPSWAINSEIEWFGTLRGRIGYLAKPDLLIFATGGLAWAQVNSDIRPLDAETGEPYGTNGFASAETNHIGYAVGGGAEWKITSNVSLKAEYLYVDLGEEDYGYVGSKTNGNGIYGTDHHVPELELHVLRAGLNYRF